MNRERLKQARLHKGLTLTEVAKHLNVSNSAPGQWERGEKTPMLDRLEPLAKLYGVSVAYLMGQDSADLSQGNPAFLTPASLIADPETPPGLKELAANAALVTDLAITSAEWAALRSLNAPRMLSANAYLAILAVLRGT